MWRLPQIVEIFGNPYDINADYRDILNAISHLSGQEKDYEIRLYVALNLFYKDFESIPDDCYEEACKKMIWFISCGEPDDGSKHPKRIDWEQDKNLIIADINCTIGKDIRSPDFCHWWTFISYFNGIGEGALSSIVSIREKKRTGKKLTKEERAFYAENRKQIDFQSKYSNSENEILREFGGV